MTSPRVILAQTLRLVGFLLLRIYYTVCNERNVFTLLLNFCANFSLIFIWLMIFKNASIIPNEIRPPIHVKLLPGLECFIYDVSSVNGWLSMALISALSYLMYEFFYRARNVIIDTEKLGLEEYNLDLISSSSSELTPSRKSQQEDDYVSYTSQSSQVPLTANTKIHYRRLAPPSLLLISWFILNFEHYISTYQTTTLDLLAWFSYVLCHFCAPLFTLIWLYIFHLQGAVKWFALCLGIQNISGVITHLLFPNAAPWFLHLYGPDEVPNYNMLGYAAGLVRVDVALGTHLNSSGFHKSPIVFGAFPSLHSAMAVLCFYHLCYYARWNLAPCIGGVFVLVQWWTTMYLDHHWRIDLLGGMLYAFCYFTILQKRLLKIENDFKNARLLGNYLKSSTVGMRLFKDTKFENFFDPIVNELK